jgi:hypothetical protein
MKEEACSILLMQVHLVPAQEPMSPFQHAQVPMSFQPIFCLAPRTPRRMHSRQSQEVWQSIFCRGNVCYRVSKTSVPVLMFAAFTAGAA